MLNRPTVANLETVCEGLFGAAWQRIIIWFGGRRGQGSDPHASSPRARDLCLAASDALEMSTPESKFSEGLALMRNGEKAYVKHSSKPMLCDGGLTRCDQRGQDAAAMEAGLGDRRHRVWQGRYAADGARDSASVAIVLMSMHSDGL